MFCDEVLDELEAIAAGEVLPEGRVSAHLASCRNCGTALARARRIESLLAERASPAAPPPFTGRVLARVRRARWRTEQYVDVGFNFVIVIGLLIVAASLWLLLERTGLGAVGGGVFSLFGAGVSSLAHRVAPLVPVYLAAAGLLGGALGLWWWAEHSSASNWR
jgi:anti-sigma factor RsiW